MTSPRGCVHTGLEVSGERQSIEERVEALSRELEPVLKADPERALKRIARAPEELREHPEIMYVRGVALWRRDGPAAARAVLERAITRDPEFADARHALGDVLGLLDDHKGMVAQWLEVRRLDALADRAQGRGAPAVRAFIEEVAEEVLEEVPEEFRARLGNLSVVLEPRPSRGIIEEGFDPRALGLFEGPDDFGQRSIHAAPMMSRIVLFYMNLEASFPEREALADEVEITIFHELGHYFGLDEHDVERLGLE